MSEKIEVSYGVRYYFNGEEKPRRINGLVHQDFAIQLRDSYMRLGDVERAEAVKVETTTKETIL